MTKSRLSEDLGSYDRTDWYPTSRNSASGGGDSGTSPYDVRNRNSTTAYEAEDQYTERVPERGQERGRAKQRFTAPSSAVRAAFSQRQQHYEREGGSTPRSQFDGTSSYTSTTDKHGDKPSRSGVRGPKAWGGSQSPARSDVSSLSSRQRNLTFGRSPSRSGSRSPSNDSTSSSRSSSSSSRSGSRRTGTVKSEVASKKEIIVTAVTVGGGSGSGSGGSGGGSGGENSGEKRNLGICIRGLPMRSTDSSLRDGLYHEYKKHGKVTSVSIFGQGDDRYAIVSFKKPEDATKAIEASHEKMFFGTKIHVTSHEGFEAEDDFKAPEADLDEFHPKATRTLFVGNLEKEITILQLKDIFKPFGEIIDIDIKKQGAVSAYAFVQYGDITSVVRALRQMDGEHIGANKIKLGFGKSMPTNCVWLDNVSETVAEKVLCRQFGRYGSVSHSVIDKVKGRALIYFDNMDYAQHAVNEMRARVISGKKIHIDFASRDCQTSFFEKMERTGQLRPGERPDERAGRVHRTASGTYSVRYDPTVTIAATTEITKEVPREKEAAFVATRSTRLSRADSGDSSYTFNSPGTTTQPRTFPATTTTVGRGNFSARGGRASRTARPGFFEGAYTQDSEFRERGRQRGHYDDYNQEGAYGEDTYEQELRAYGYRQQERRERGSLSPRDKRGSREVRAESPFSRGSRHPSPVHDTRHAERYDDRYSDRYSDRYRDTDSQSGDRESVRSYRSVRSEARRSEFRQQTSFDDRYPERFVEEKRDHVRGFSPTSSDYSHHSGHSPSHYRSRSTSPAVSVGKERKVMNVKERVVVRQVVAASSLDGYTQSSRHSSPLEYEAVVPSGKLKDIKLSKYSSNPMDTKSKEHYPETRDSRERYGSEERTTISKLIGKTRTGSTYNDSEKITAVSSKVKKPKFDSDDEVSDMDRVSEVKDRPYKKRHSEDVVVEKDRTTDDGNKKLHKHRSRSTSLGSRTRHSIPNDSSDTVDYIDSSGTVSKPTRDVVSSEVCLKAKTKNVKLDLLRCTKKNSEPYDPFEAKSESGESSSNSSSGSSGESSSEEEASSFVEPSPSTLSSSTRLQQEREHLLSLIKQLDESGSTSDNDSHLDDNGTRKRLRLDEGSEAESRAKSRQLLYEEIEQTKLSIQELDREQREKAPQIDSTKSYRKQMEQQRIEQQKHTLASGGLIQEVKVPGSPQHVSWLEIDQEVVEPTPVPSPKEIPTEFKKKRKGDTEIDLNTSKTRRYRGPNATDDLFARMNEVDCHKKGRKEAPEIKEADMKVVDGRSSSVDMSKHPSRQSSIESQDPRSPPLEYSSSSMGMRRDRADSDSKDSPMDRRSLHLAESQSKKDFPMSLPLPKFARQPMKDNHTGGKNSPKSLVSPKTITSSLTVAAIPSGMIQVKSPPFSPGGALASPLHSPALPKGDTPKEASSLPNSTTTTPTVLSKDKDIKHPLLVLESPREKPSLKGMPMLASPGSPVFKDSDSEVSESEPGELSLEERIRQLDEKLSQKPPSTPSSTSLFDYREKYKIRKRADSSTSSLSSLSDNRSEPSDIVKSLLARTSIFDQDSKRLEQIHEKYEPKMNVILDDTARSLGVFRTKASAKELPLLALGGLTTMTASLGPEAGSAPQLSPPFLGAPASAAPAEITILLSAGEMLGNNTNSSSGVATGAFNDAAFPSAPPHKVVGGGDDESPLLPPPPPTTAGPQSTPPSPVSPTILTTSSGSTQPARSASPKLTGLDTMPQLSVAVNTPAMSPGLISRKGSLESATKSPLTPPVATTATSNIAAMPSPSQTKPPQLECLTPPQLECLITTPIKKFNKESVSSSISHHSSTSSAPSTPVSILKKQDSNEVFSPVTQITPILKKEMPPLTPILREPTLRKDPRIESQSYTAMSSTGTPLQREIVSQPTSILGKRKTSDETKEKLSMLKQEKGNHKSSSLNTMPKHEPGTSKPTGEQTEAKKGKVVAKEKASKSSSQKDGRKASTKQSSSSSNSKSPEKKNLKADTKELAEKKKQDDKHMKHVEKMPSKDRSSPREEEPTDKPKLSEPAKEKIWEAEKELPKVKEHQEREQKDVSKSKEVKHKFDKVKELKEVPEKKVEKVEPVREKKRSKSGDIKHRDKERTPSIDLKTKTTNDKHKDKHKTVEKPQMMSHDKTDKVDKEEKQEPQEKIEKVDPRIDKMRVEHTEKAKTESKEKPTKHDKKIEKQEPKLKHKDKSKDNSKEKKEDKNKTGHESRESSIKPEKKITKDGEKKKAKQKERDQDKADRKDGEKNRDGPKTKSDKKNKDLEAHKEKDKETDSSSVDKNETKEEREKREMRELLELQDRLNAEEGYGLTMYDKVKRRSSKERDKEFEFAARQKQFSAYQSSWRLKKRPSRSEYAGSSTQNSDNESATSSSTMEMPSTKRERSESKSKSRKQRIIESSSEAEDEFSAPDLLDMPSLKEKEMKKTVVKVENAFDLSEDDMPVVTPVKKLRKKDQQDKKEKPKKKKPVPINSDTDEEIPEKEVYHIPPSPAPTPGKAKEKKVKNKTKIEPSESKDHMKDHAKDHLKDQTIEYTKDKDHAKDHPMVAKNQKMTPKAKAKKNRIFSSDDEMELVHIKALKKESSAKKHAILDTSTTEEEELVMPKPKAKKHKEKVPKHRVIDSDSEDKDQEKPPVTTKTHKEKMKEKAMASVIFTTVSEMDGLPMDPAPALTPTPKQKKNKDKHKLSQRKEKALVDEMRWEEPVEIKHERPEKPKDKEESSGQSEWDPHHMSKGSPITGKDKESSHNKSGKTVSETSVLKERDSHGNKDQKSRNKDHGESCTNDGMQVEKERGKDRSHQDAIASMILEIRTRGEVYEEDPNMPNLDEDKHPLDELLKEEARLDAEKKRDEKLFGHHHDSNKKNDYCHNDLGPPEIRIKMEDISDVDIKEPEPPKLRDEESLKKQGKREGIKKGKKAKRKCKVHEENTVCSTSNLDNEVPPSMIVLKEEPIDQLPSLTKENLSEQPPILEENAIKEELPRPDIRRSGTDNIFEKMEMKEDGLLTVETGVSLSEAPSLQPVILSPSKKEVKKEAEKLKETSQDELQRAVESILGTDTPPATSAPTRIDYPEEQPPETFIDPLEDSPLVIESEVISQPSEVVDLPSEPEATDVSTDVTAVNEQDEEEARNAAAALAFLQDNTEHLQATVLLTEQTVSPEEAQAEAEIPQELELPAEEMQEELQPEDLEVTPLQPEPIKPSDISEEETPLKAELEVELPQQVSDQSIKQEIPDVTTTSEVVEIPKLVPKVEPEKPEDVIIPQTQSSEVNEASKLAVFLPESESEVVPIPVVQPEPVTEPLPTPITEPLPTPITEPLPTPITELLPTPITEPLPTPVLVVATPPMSPVLPPVLLSHPVIPTQVVEPLSMLLPLPKSDPIVKETKKDPYIFDEEEPEEGVPLLDKLRHKPHVEPRPVLSTLKAPILEETLASIVHDIPKIKSPELGSPDRRILSETEKVDTPVRKPKRQRTPKSARGRKKVEQELRSEIEFKEEGPRLEMDKDELKISENQENVFDHVRMELRREEKPEIRQSPRAKEKAVIPLTPVSSTSLFVEDKPIFEQPDRPELKMKFPLDPEAQKKVRGEGKKQEALETVSAPLEPPVVKLTAPLHEEPLHTIEPPTNTEDLAVDEPTKAHQVSEDELTTDEPSELFSETVPPMRRTKGKTKKANKDDNREEMETKESSGSLTMTLSLRDVQRSPSTRGRGKQEEQAAAKKEVPEVTFSSRGRKIIPKERDGEVAPVGRKGRSKQAGPVAPENPESRGRGRRGAGSPAAAMMEPDVAAPRLKPQRSRRTSKRLEKEEEVQDCEEGKKDSLKSPENKEDAEDELSDNDGRVGRRVPKRRISLRRGLPVGSDKDRAVDKDENRDDSSKDGFFHEENSIGRSETDTSTTEIVPDAPRQKKGRRKGRKFIEGSSLSPRRAEVPPGSPRAKGLEMGSTSPKNTEYKPVVKLEKLSNVEEMLRHQDSNRAPKEETIRKEDEVRDREEGEHLLVITGNVAPRTGITFSRLGDRLGVRPINANPDAALKQTCGAKPKKDQYDFEDDEEKAPAGYVPRRTKRKVAERMSPRRYDEVSQDPASAPEQQPAKRLKIEGKTETSTQDSRRSDDVKSVPERLPETPAVKKADEEKNVYLDPKTGLLQSIPASASPEAPQTPDATTSTLAEATPRPDVTKRDVKPEVKPHVDDGNTRVTITPPYVVPPSKADLRKEERAAAATHQQPAPPVKAEPTVPPLKITIPISSKSSTPSWETNIDKVIEAVARGDFSQENDDNDFVQKRSRRRSQDQHSPHSVPESKPQPQPAATVLVTSAACPVVPPITVSKASRAMPATTQVLHGAPQVAFPPLPYPHSTAPITTTLSKVVATHAGMPQTTLVPSMHAMPQQLPHPGPQTAQLHPLQVASPGAVKSPGPGAMMQLQQQPLISKSTPSSVIQPPHHTTTPTSSGGGAGLNPLLQLQQAGYPMRESGNEKDQRVTRQQSPAGAKPAVSSAASVQMDVVQQAYSISHQEASPPGQVGKFNVIEIVPNPNIISPKSSPGEPSIHLPPSISQQQREAQQQREQQQKHQQQQHQQQQEQQRAAVSGTKVSPHGHTGHHMPPSQVSKDQKHGGTTHPGPLMQHFSPYSHPTILSQQTTTTTQSSSLPQTSELRAALATPSKLQQQEQFLQQQQRLQQQQQQQQQQLMRPHQPLTPHQQEQQQQPSPGNTFGLHRMPFTFPDQRQAISRAEPKVSQEQRADMATSQAQYREHLQKGPPTNTGPGGSSAFSQPHPGQGVPLGHPEGRTLPYPGAELRFPHPGVVGYPGGPPPGMAMGLGPRLSIDPRFMFAGPGVQPPQSGPGHPAHHDYLMGQGMMPQHLRSQHTSHQQPPTAVDQILLQDRPPSGRPLSRTTPPSAQPSPRGTPTPGGGRELTPQGLSPGSIPSALTQHPSQALNSLMKGPGSLQEVQHHADNLYMILRRYPVMWQGVLALKNDSSNVQMHYLAGSQRLVKQALPAMTLDGHSAPLRIAQRMRLEQSQLDGVHRKMQNEEEYSMLLAIPCGRDHIDIMTQTKALQSGFIQYLSSKQAAGIVNVAEPGSASQQPAYVVHIFPQCEFSHQQMADLTPDLLQGIHEISHLLIVIATVGTQ